MATSDPFSPIERALSALADAAKGARKAARRMECLGIRILAPFEAVKAARSPVSDGSESDRSEARRDAVKARARLRAERRSRRNNDWMRRKGITR